MTPLRLARIVTPAAFVLSACAGNDASPVGVELLPGNAIGGLRAVVSTGFAQFLDFTVFPAERGQADRLTSAHDWPTPEDFESRVIIRFDVTTIDSLNSQAALRDPSLRLVFVEVDHDVTFTVHRLTHAWNEEAATWNRRDFGVPWDTPGGDFDPTPLAEFTLTPLPPDSTVTDSTDSTATRADSVFVPLPIELVEEWRAGTIPPDGLLLLQQTPGEVVNFVSRGEQGTNPNGPAIQVTAELPDGPLANINLLAVEDIFLPIDRSPFPAGGIVVRGVEPPRRALIEPTLEGVPAGSTIADVRLVLTIQAVEIPRDSLPIVLVQPLSEFQGENTLFAPVLAALAGATLGPQAQPGDTVAFEAPGLTRIARLWLADPEGNLGLGLRLPDAGPGAESLFFGGVQFYGLDAPEALRPRLRVLYVPSSLPAGGS